MVIEAGFCFFAAAAALTVPLKWLLGLGLAVFIHEGGHYLALRYFSVPVMRLRLAAGGATLETGPMTAGEEFFCALAGPAAGLVTVLFARLAPRTALCALCQSVWNLLPIGQRDGARALRQICPRAFPAVEGVTAVMILGLCPFLGFPGIWVAAAVLTEKFLAKNRVRDYNRPTIDKEVRL